MDKKYDFSKFSDVDTLAYKKILEALPYDETLEALFIDSKRLEARQAKSDLRHISVYIFDENKGQRNMLDSMEGSDIKMLLDGAMERLSSAERRRVKAYFYYGLTQREIADMEGVNIATISRSIALAIKKMYQYCKQ